MIQTIDHGLDFSMISIDMKRLRDGMLRKHAESSMREIEEFQRKIWLYIHWKFFWTTDIFYITDQLFFQ